MYQLFDESCFAHLENVHVQSELLVPGQQAVVVVHLTTVRTHFVRQVITRLLHAPA